MKLYKYIFLSLLLFWGTVSASGQRNKTRISTKNANSAVDVETLLKEYRFEEVSKALQNQISQATKKKLPTEELEAMAEKARIGANMITATAKIIFVDSVVVNKTDILSAIKLDKSCGTLNYWKDIFEPNKNIWEDVTVTTTHTNDFKDRILYCYPNEEGHTKLYIRYMIDSKWSDPDSLNIGEKETDEINPYQLSDGMTLYYGSTAPDGLGGYDIYVTRYNTNTKNYLKAENMGMPYNSTANDYLLAIDETNNLGWLVSDRNQPEGKVCIYIFIPNDTREVYDLDPTEEKLRNLATIHDIAATQENNKSVVMAARQKIKDLANKTKNNSAEENSLFSLPICKGVVYKSFQDFKSTKARQMAENWKNLYEQRNKLLKELKEKRKEYSPAIKGNLKKQEQALEQLDDTINDLEWNIRYEEQSKLGIYK